MARLSLFISLGLALSSLPSGLAGPACAKKHFQVADCVSICQSRWGWTGMMMGTDPWGSVVKKMDSTTNLNAVISQACGSSVVATPTASSDFGSMTMSTASPTPYAIPSYYVTASATSSATRSITTPVSSSSSSSSAHSSSTSAPSSSKAMSQTALGLIVHHSSSSAASPQPTPANFAPTNSPPAAEKHENTPTPQNTPAAQNTPAPASDSGSDSSSSGGTSSADIQAYLAGHNTIRAQHGASPLTWNDNLASKAQQWANGCKFVHSGGTLGPFGENLAAGTGSDYDIPTAIKSWTDEVSEYNPSNPVASHFTQVVWKASTEVGCAVQTCSGIFAASFGPAKYFVCEYFVQGNVEGQFGQNVQL